MKFRFNLIFFIAVAACLGLNVRAQNKSDQVELSGHYIYIFSNGAPPKTNEYYFTAQLNTNGYVIAITNTTLTGEWGVIRSDGKNIYTIAAERMNPGKIFAHAYPGSFFIPEGDNSPHFFFPWMVFCLNPEVISNYQKTAGMGLPAPWGKRFSLFDDGFKWAVDYSENNQWIEKIETLRDSSLDLKSDEAELRRQNLNYAFQISSQDHRLQSLRDRRGVPNGYTRAIYEAGKICQTNGWSLPLTAKFELYFPMFGDPGLPKRLVYELSMHVDEIHLAATQPIPELTIPGKVSVFDYRFQASNDRTKFNYAAYDLPRGGEFPPDNDPKLRAEAAEFLKHGPGYGSFKPKRYIILTGILVVSLGFCGLLIFQSKKRAN